MDTVWGEFVTVILATLVMIAAKLHALQVSTSTQSTVLVEPTALLDITPIYIRKVAKPANLHVLNARDPLQIVWDVLL